MEFENLGELCERLHAAVAAAGQPGFEVVGVSILTIVGFALLYPLAGGMEKTGDGDAHFTFLDTGAFPLGENARILFENLYFSAVTFTTLGYGDIQPASDAAQLLASIESFLGALLMALLVFVLGRRTTW